MIEQSLFGPWVRRFVLEYLPNDRNLARNTQQSYRDMFCLLIPFLADRVKKSVDKLTVTELTAEQVRGFIQYLKEVRECGTVTCNQRLAAIHAFAYFVGTHSPEHLEWCHKIRAIPFKQAPRGLVEYLEKDEFEALLEAADRTKPQGKRDYALLLFLYNSGTRASEAAQLRIGDLRYSPSRWEDAYVQIHGKGGKTRRCPLWPLTIQTLHELINNRPPDEHVFLNRNHVPIKRVGVYEVVKRHGERAAKNVPSIGMKRVSPHVIRHSTATHLLLSGVDINTIRAWLGHVQINTTNIYAQIDLATKAKALAKCEISDTNGKNGKRWRDQPSLMEFLRNL